MISAPPAHMARDLELEALQDAARWPHTAPSTILVLAGRFLARGRDQDAYVYFRERAEAEPALPLFRALEGQFQVRLAGPFSSWATKKRAVKDRRLQLLLRVKMTSHRKPCGVRCPCVQCVVRIRLRNSSSRTPMILSSCRGTQGNHRAGTILVLWWNHPEIAGQGG